MKVPTARNVTYLRFRTSSENMISYWWMKEIYSKLPYHYKKNLKGNSYLSKYSVFILLLQTSTPCTPVCGRGWLPGGSRPSWLRPSSRSFIMSMRWKKHIETQHSRVQCECFKVKELDSIIHSTEFDIPMFIQEYDMSINGLRYYQPWARETCVSYGIR